MDWHSADGYWRTWRSLGAPRELQDTARDFEVYDWIHIRNWWIHGRSKQRQAILGSTSGIGRSVNPFCHIYSNEFASAIGMGADQGHWRVTQCTAGQQVRVSEGFLKEHVRAKYWFHEAVRKWQSHHWTGHGWQALWKTVNTG